VSQDVNDTGTCNKKKGTGQGWKQKTFMT